MLADAGLVTGERQGRERLLQIESAPLARARRDLDVISERWDHAIGRLRAHVEE